MVSIKVKLNHTIHILGFTLVLYTANFFQIYSEAQIALMHVDIRQTPPTLFLKMQIAYFIVEKFPRQQR